MLLNVIHNPSDAIFWASAIAGTTLFALRMLMTFMGGAFDAADSDIEMFDTHHGDHHHDGASLKLFTLHSLSGFLMMFGWTGLACTAQFHLSYTYALLIALAVGIGMMLITAFIMHSALKLESPGSVFSSKKAVGQVGIVYQRIPAHGQGKVHVVIDNITRELLAQSAEHTILESFTVVKVVKAIDHEIVEVVEHGKDLQ